MFKIFTIMYILCSLYISSPDKAEPAFSQNLADKAITAYNATETGNKDFNTGAEEIKTVDLDNLDYIEELKKLNYYREDSEDKNLNIRNAVIRFQSDHNMEVTGVWDEKSLEALKTMILDKDFVFPDEVTEAPTSDKWIVVNKSTRILTLYEASKVLEKYPVAIGNPPSLTPSGKFNIASKVVNPAWGGGGYAEPVEGGSTKNPLGYRWMGLSLKGGNRYGIHGNNSPYSIGKYVSHGCIRMINSDVEELFEIIGISTEVWIGTEDELKGWGVAQKKYPVQ